MSEPQPEIIINNKVALYQSNDDATAISQEEVAQPDKLEEWQIEYIASCNSYLERIQKQNQPQPPPPLSKRLATPRHGLSLSVSVRTRQESFVPPVKESDTISLIISDSSGGTLFLGNAENAKIKCCHVSAILNVTPEDSKCSHPEHTTIARLQIPILDGWHQNISQYFQSTFDFIDRYIAGGIYVHCHAGVSRSATIVIAYIMQKQRISFNEAYQLVKSKRPCISPNLDFMGALSSFEKELGIEPSHENFRL
jgi:protein-tyrosine phosphatase